MVRAKYIWINKRYELFAVHDKNGLKIVTLAKAIGISKSSYDHYFADSECFFEEL